MQVSTYTSSLSPVSLLDRETLVFSEKLERMESTAFQERADQTVFRANSDQLEQEDSQDLVDDQEVQEVTESL